jgi:hypothetical protein
MTLSLPAPLQALLREAAALDARSAWREAIDAWSRLVATSPNFVPAQVGLAQAQIRAGGASDALPALERVSALAPTGAPVWLALVDHASGPAPSIASSDERHLLHTCAVAAASVWAAYALGATRFEAIRGERLRKPTRAQSSSPDNADALNRFAAMIRAAETASAPTLCCSARSRSLRAIPHGA